MNDVKAKEHIMKATFRAALLAFLLAAAGMAGAQDLIGLDKAQALALSRSKSLQKLTLAVDAGQVAEKAQNYSLLPQATLKVGGTVDYPAASLASSAAAAATLSVSQIIYEGGKNNILAAIDRLATEQARMEARAEYLSVLQSADSAYFNVLKAQAALEAAKSDLSATKLLQSLAQAKFDSGVVIKAAVVEAQAETMSKETTLSQANKTLSVAKASFKSITGVSSLPKPIDFATYSAVMARIGANDDAATEAFISSVTASALKGNPSLSASQLVLEQAQKSVDAAKAAYLPSVSAAWSHSAAYSASSGLDLASEGSLSLTVSIPLDQYATKNTVQGKTIVAAQASLSKESAVEDLRLEIMSDVYDLTSAVRSVSSSQKALEYAQSNYEVKLELYKLSKASSSELSDAELLVSSSRSSLISAQYAFLSGLSSLRTAAGLESEALLLAMLK
jgi:outer membrane protein TolC